MTDAAPGPIYDRIKRDIRAAIARDQYDPAVPFITQREVCDRYGVSSTTAVRALNDLVAEGVLVRRRGKGTFVAEQPTPDPYPTDRSIACIVYGLPGPHVSQLISGVESLCAELGWRMFLSDSDGSAQREERALRQAITAGASGVVLYPVEGQANAELLEELRRRGTPVVLVDRYRTDLATDAVIVDNVMVGYQLTKHLIDRGHRRIGTLWSETDCTSVRDRLAGHKMALNEHQLPVIAELAMLRSYWPQPEAERRAQLSRLLTADEPPTALLCANGYVLATAASDLLHLGFHIPGEIALAGMDDAGPYDILPLTTVAASLPSREMGRRAAELLARRIGSDDPYRNIEHVVLPVEVRQREIDARPLQAVNPAAAP